MFELNMGLNIAENIIYIYNIIQWSIRIAQRAANSSLLQYIILA